MNFQPDWDAKERIQLLQLWILVHSFIYYELNDNVASDFNYDANVNSLFELKRNYPDAWAHSQYYKIFENYEEGCTSGFELLEKTRRLDWVLYNHIHVYACIALDMKRKKGAANGYLA